MAGFDSSFDYRVRIYGYDNSGIVDRSNQRFETISSDQYYFDDQSDKWYLDYMGDTFLEHVGETLAINIDVIDRAQTAQGWNLENSSTYYAAYSTPVPEPTTMLLFGTGLLGLAGARRKVRKV